MRGATNETIVPHLGDRAFFAGFSSSSSADPRIRDQRAFDAAMSSCRDGASDSSGHESIVHCLP